ncbi:DUF3577 domain-containing protein, partial [Glaesserella parasuis]
GAKQLYFLYNPIMKVLVMGFSFAHILIQEAKKKVLISFVMADLWVDTFTYTSDSKYHKKGDTGTTLKGRLIRIKMLKIDGELKYQEPKRDTDESNA